MLMEYYGVEVSMIVTTEIVVCDVCERGGATVPNFWNRWDIHLCEPCARKVLMRIGKKSIQTAVKKCRGEEQE